MTKKLFFLASIMLVVLVGCNKEKKTDPTPDTKKNEPVNITLRLCTSQDLMTYTTEKVFFTAEGEQETELQLGNPIQLTATNDPAFHELVNNFKLSDSLFYYYDVPLKVKRGTHSVRYEYIQKVDSMPAKLNIAIGSKIGHCDEGVVCIHSSVVVMKGMKGESVMNYLNNVSANPDDFTIY